MIEMHTHLRQCFIALVMQAKGRMCARAAVGRSGGDNPVRDGFEQGGLCAVWWGLLVARPIVHNVSRVCDVLAANSNVI